MYPGQRKRDRERERERERERREEKRFQRKGNSQPQEAETTWHGLYSTSPKSCVYRDNRRAFGSRERSREIALFFHYNGIKQHGATAKFTVDYREEIERDRRRSVFHRASRRRVRVPYFFHEKNRRGCQLNAETNERARANFILQL